MADQLPDEMHLLFENGLFLGAFVDREKAESLQDARNKAGKPRSELVTYQRKT